jgi:hypothetical protein
MVLRLWNQSLEGNQVPTVVPLINENTNILCRYSEFRQQHCDNTADQFVSYLQGIGYAENTALDYWQFLSDGQMRISRLSDQTVHDLAIDPNGREARVFLHQWYRCRLDQLPKYLSIVFIVGALKLENLNDGDINERIINCGYANHGNSINNLRSVAKGMGRHFGFFDNNDVPTAFFNSFFQSSF